MHNSAKNIAAVRCPYKIFRCTLEKLSAEWLLSILVTRSLKNSAAQKLLLRAHVFVLLYISRTPSPPSLAATINCYRLVSFVSRARAVYLIVNGGNADDDRHIIRRII